MTKDEKLRNMLKDMAYNYHHLGQTLDAPISFDKVDETLYDLKKLIEESEQKPIGLVGWVCPVCGRGNSPYTSTCPCIQGHGQITC